MEIGAIFAPTIDTPEHVQLAEELGYAYALVYDSPTFLADPWLTLAGAASRTTRIRVGVSVLTPRLRHLVANAGAIATLHAMAPGRVVMVLGTGYTSQLMIGKRPAAWREVEDYLVALRDLLAGREIEWDGAIVALRHGKLTGIPPAAAVPLWMAAHGPKGYATAARVADGVVTYLTHGSRNELGGDLSHAFVLFYGTVLDPGEGPGDERVLHAAGPTAAFQLHLGGEGAVGGTPEGRGYQRAIGAIDERRRHLAINSGHLVEVTDLERPLITPDLIVRATETGTGEQVAARLREIAALGVGGVLFGPQGPDIRRELRSFAEAAGLR
jgi:5,10-methylenetetrahydromethanopterin reductase